MARTQSSRRRFLKLLAAGSAAVATAAVPSVTPAATRAKAKESASRPMTAKVRAEITSQKRYVARALETIRAFPLPPGSDPAFVFTPLEPKRARTGSDRGTSSR